MMHIQQNIMKNITLLQDDSKKKNPDLYRECEEMLMKIKEIDGRLEKYKAEPPTESTSVEEIEAIKAKRNECQIRPFIKALGTRKKVPVYVYDAISILMSEMTLEDGLVLELTDSLIKHLNLNKDHAIKIFQLFFFVIQYGCVRDEVIITLFYSLINILDVNNPAIVTNAKAMSKQVVFVIFMRFKNAYIQLKNGMVTEEEYFSVKKDCKIILNDIYEFMNLKNDSKINIELSLEFIEIIFKVEEIFHVSEIKEIFIRLINQIDMIGGVDESEYLRIKHSNIILSIVKSKLFSEEASIFIEKSTNNLHIFDPETLLFLYDREHEKETFFTAAKKNILSTNVQIKNKYQLIFNIFNFLRLKNSTIQVVNNTNEKLSTQNDTFDYTIDVFKLFFENVPIVQKEEDNLIEILKYLIPNSIENKERLFILIQKMMELEGNFAIECFKACCRIKEHLTNEWKLLFDYIDKRNDMNCFNYFLQESANFTPQELFYVLAFVESPEHIRIIFKRAMNIITKDLSCVITVFSRVYYDVPLLCTVIDEYLMFLTEHDLESEVLPFLFINSIFKKYSIKDVLEQHAPLLLFKNYNNRIKSLNNVSIICDKKNNADESEYKKLLLTVFNGIRVLNNQVNASWIIIFDILQITTEYVNLSMENFKILQIISEDFYTLLTDACKIRIPGFFYRISMHEIENINIVLQILNLISDNSKGMNKVVVQFEIWKEYLTSVIGIIKKEKMGWNDIFDTGLVIIYNILGFKDLINDDKLTMVNEIAFDLILTEILGILKDLFYTKIVFNKDTPYEVKKRSKETLILGLQKTNDFLLKSTDRNNFIDEYHRFIADLICFRHELNERGFEQWKDEIAMESLRIFENRNNVLGDNFLFILENIPILLNENHTDEEEKLYYKTKVYMSLLNFDISKVNQKVFMEKMQRFFTVKNLDIRDKIFGLIEKNSKENNVLYFCTQWLKTEDKDVLSRLLAILKDYFRCVKDDISFTSPCEEESMKNSKKESVSISGDGLSKSKITFEKSGDHVSEISIMKNLMKNLTVLINYDIFWEDLICVIQLIALNIRENFELVKYFIDLARFIFNNKQGEGEKNPNIVTMYGAVEPKKSSFDSLFERKREKVLMELIDIYMSVISCHFISDSEHVNESFVDLSFSLVHDLSFIQSGCFRENLSGKCLDILFKHSRFTRDLLIKRIRLGLSEYVKEINIFRDVHSRVKRNEMFQILDGIIENPSLVKDLKNEIIDALSSKDFNTIEKIKVCLKKGL